MKKENILITILKSIIGISCLAVSFFFLFENDSVALRNYMSFKDERAEITSVPHDKINPDNNNKLIYTHGEMESPVIKDKVFGIRVEALELERIVEIYQWHEFKNVKKTKSDGGQKAKQYTYHYKKDWSRNSINSNQFYLKEKHKNPNNFPYKNKLYTTRAFLLGHYIISNEDIKDVIKPETLSVSKYFHTLEKYGDIFLKDKKILTEKITQLEHHPQEFKVIDDVFYKGRDINNPEIGDIIVRYKIIIPTTISVIGTQNGRKIGHYYHGNKYIMNVKKGVVSPEDIFRQQIKSEYVAEILIALGTFVLMFIGLFLIKMPLRKLILLIPYFGIYIAFSSKKRFFLISFLLSIIITGAVWLPHLPTVSLAAIIPSLLILIVLRHKDYYE